MKATIMMLLALCALGRAAAVDSQKDRPVSKVITLLKDMIAQMEKEAEEDEDIYEQMGCWCETNDKEKTAAIADGKQKIGSLTAAIEGYTASSAKLNAEIGNLGKEIEKNQGALDSAAGIRAKQSAEFVAEEKDMLQSIGSMKSAVIALSKHNKGASMLQVSEGESMRMLATAKHLAKKHQSLLEELATPSEQRAMRAFVQSGASAPASGEIFGMLEAMKESFETNLAAAQKTEAAEAKAFEDLKSAKTSEIAAGQQQLDAKSTELATAKQNNAQAKTDLEGTGETLDADTKFLADVKEQCATMDQEFEERTKTRQLEMAAVSKALEFLSSDEAHALFTKTFNPSMLQQRSERKSDSQRRALAARVLTEAAHKSHDSRLMMLAVRARMDAFGNLKKTIKSMIDALEKEKEDEMKQKDFCVEQFNTNTKETEDATSKKQDLDASIAKLKEKIAKLSKEIADLNAEVAELSKNLKWAGEDREKANNDFKVIVSDQRATQKLLTTALGILKGFYEKGALVQTSTGYERQPAFKKYEKNKASGGVMGMMQSIIDDAKALEAEAIRGETDAQKEYEEFVQATNESLEAKKKEITAKSQVKAKTDAESLEEEVALDQTMSTLDQLATELGDIHRSCDFLMKNFEVRTKARDAEIEGLKQAIALFSGAKMAALLQHW